MINKYRDELEQYKQTGMTADEILEMKKLVEEDYVSTKSANLILLERCNELQRLVVLAVSELKECADDNGGCYGCVRYDHNVDQCESLEMFLNCDSKTNNGWKWKYEDEAKSLGVEFDNGTIK